MNITDKQLNFTPALYQYVFSHNPEENIHLKNLRLRTDQLKYARLRSPTEQVQLITFLLKLLKPKNILELGTFTGYTTLAMALAADNETKIMTCDINNIFPGVGIPFWEQSSVGHKIQLILGPALKTISKLEEQNALFDFIYIDADKENYLNYFEKSLKILHKNGLIVIDNVLWHGQVVDTPLLELRAKTVDALNKKIKNTLQIDYCLLPFCDGITLVKHV